jgi:hypothetical protein
MCLVLSVAARAAREGAGRPDRGLSAAAREAK